MSNEKEATILLADAEVFSVDQNRASLLIEHADAEKIIHASERGTIRLVRASEVSSAQAQAEDRLRQLEQHLGAQHPSVQALRTRIDQLAKHSAKRQALREDQEREKQTRSLKEFEIVAKELFPDAKIDLRAIGNGVVLSGTVNDYEQDRVLSSIAAGLFPNVINNLRRSDSTHTSSAHIGEKLQKTLAELFPNAEIKVLPLNGSVVLSGTIESESAKQAVEIAQDFYPQVIDHTRRPNTASLPSRSNVTLTAEQPTGKTSSINAELHELREDVRVLRRDVSRLIDILEDCDCRSLKAAPPDDDHSSNASDDADEVVWQLIGIRVEQTEVESDKYRGGLKIVEVRRESPAAKEGIQQGDILVGLYKWETTNRTNLHYVARQIDELKPESLKFYVLRGGSVRFGHMNLGMLTEEAIKRTLGSNSR